MSPQCPDDPLKPALLIDGLLVDLEALFGLAHQCSDRACRLADSCCSNYQVDITKQELSVIVGTMPVAARFARNLHSEDGLANIFEEAGRSRLTLDTTDDGCCVFAYASPTGHPRCSLHTAALTMGLPPHRIKPSCCALWPLSLSEDPTPVLGIHDDAFDYPCNRQRRRRTRRLDPGVAAILDAHWGRPFRDHIIQARRRMPV